MSAVDVGGALDTSVAAVAGLVGDVDIPCEAAFHEQNGYGRVEHVAVGHGHEDCTVPLVPVCEGCLAVARETVTRLRSGPHTWAICYRDAVVQCVHHLVLVVHPIRCAP